MEVTCYKQMQVVQYTMEYKEPLGLLRVLQEHMGPKGTITDQIPLTAGVILPFKGN